MDLQKELHFAHSPIEDRQDLQDLLNHKQSWLHESISKLAYKGDAESNAERSNLLGQLELLQDLQRRIKN